MKYPVRAFQDQHTLPKRNILEQLTITVFRTFQDQHTLPKRNILFPSHNLYQNWSLDIMEILPMTLTLQRPWFHWGAPSSQGNRPGSRATQWPVSDTFQLDVVTHNQIPEGTWTPWIQTCWYQSSCHKHRAIVFKTSGKVRLEKLMILQ